MMSDQLGTTNVWLAILAIVSVIELLIVLAMGLAAFLLYTRVTTLVNRVEAAYVVPIAAEARDLIRKAQRLEERVGSMVTKVEDTAAGVRDLGERLWPVMGTFRAVSAAVSSFRGGGRRSA